MKSKEIHSLVGIIENLQYDVTADLVKDISSTLNLYGLNSSRMKDNYFSAASHLSMSEKYLRKAWGNCRDYIEPNSPYLRTIQEYGIKEIPAKLNDINSIRMFILLFSAKLRNQAHFHERKGYVRTAGHIYSASTLMTAAARELID